jgi:importin subunit beta-1
MVRCVSSSRRLHHCVFLFFSLFGPTRIHTNTHTTLARVAQREKQAAWCEYSPEFREHVKAQAIGTLGTEGRPPSTAAQVIAFIACAEIPNELWPDALPTLLAGLEGDAPELQRASVLEAVGYV